MDGLVTDNSYTKYEDWYICAVRKDYQDYPENFPEDYNPCENCKHRQFSYEEIRRAREEKKEHKRYCRYMDKHPEEFEVFNFDRSDFLESFSPITCPF